MQPLHPFSLVIPVLNEEDNITSLAHEIAGMRKEEDSFEVIFVDDHSTDRTPEIIKDLTDRFSWVRTVRLSRQSGQSAALWHGIYAARFPLIATMDGDGQNDPADIRHMVDVHRELSADNPCCLVNGWRTGRQDSGWRKFCSRFANSIRSRLLKDDTPDSGCGIKIFSRETFLALPAFTHMHRFVPALVRQRGGKVVSVPVNHRTRKSGKSHYGTLDRLFAGILDLLGVLWLGKRAIRCDLAGERRNE